MAKVVRIHTGEQFCSAVIGEPGRLFTPYVTFGYPIRKRRMPNAEAARSRDLMKGKRPYPLKLACNRLLSMGRHGNITKGARKFLQEVKREA